MWSVMPPLPEVKLYSAWTCLPTQRQTCGAEKGSSIYRSRHSAHFWLNQVIISLYMLKKDRDRKFPIGHKNANQWVWVPIPCSEVNLGSPLCSSQEPTTGKLLHNLYFWIFLGGQWLLRKMLICIFFLVCSKYWDCARSFQILLLIFIYSLLIFTNDKTDTKASWLKILKTC